MFVNGEDIHVHFFSSYMSLQRDGGCFVFNGPQHPTGQLPKSTLSSQWEYLSETRVSVVCVVMAS